MKRPLIVIVCASQRKNTIHDTLADTWNRLKRGFHAFNIFQPHSCQEYLKDPLKLLPVQILPMPMTESM